MYAVKLILFSLLWLVIAYGVNCGVAGKRMRVEPKMALLYFSTVALIGVFGEIFLDSTYNHLAGRPLWYYNILPVQGGYTSSFAIVTWGILGFYLYLMHDNLESKWSITKTKHLALIFSLEALVIEALVTISAKLLLGQYLYYYLPGDLWHVSSLQNIPFYFICGVAILKTTKRFRRDPYFFSAMSFCLIYVLIFLV